MFLSETPERTVTTRFLCFGLVVCACWRLRVCVLRLHLVSVVGGLRYAICDIRYAGMRCCAVSVGLGVVRADGWTHGRTHGRMNGGRAREKKPKAESRYRRTQPQPLLYLLPLALAKGRNEAMRDLPRVRGGEREVRTGDGGEEGERAETCPRTSG